MKRVPFEIAKALKDAGYPQDYRTSVYYSNEDEDASGYGYQKGDEISYDAVHKNQIEAISAPTYLDVWLWLWQKKKICIEIKDNYYYTLAKVKNQRLYAYSPEEAIIDAIEYLVKNNLIK